MKDYDLFKPFRNSLRKLNHYSVVEHAIARLHLASRRGLPVIQKGLIPWELLLLVKWTLAEFDVKSASLPPISNDEMNHLQAKVNKLFDDNDFLFGSDPFKVQKYFRQIAFQQFWLQSPLSPHSLIQQLRLFLRPDRSEKFEEMFLSTFGVSLSDYMKVALLLKNHFAGPNSQQMFVSASDFANLKLEFIKRAILPVLRNWSLDLESAQTFAREEFERYDVRHQLYEQSPLKEYPLLKIGEKYWCYSPALIDAKIDSCIYDGLKGAFKGHFTQEFGEIVEAHVGENLRFSELKFKSEAQLKKELGDGLLPDFVIETDNARIFIESKSIELWYRARIDPTTANMTRGLKGSVIKAISQIHGAASRTPRDGKALYGLIVTYKQLYLGSSERAWNEFLRKPVSEFLASRGLNSEYLPPKNILFLTLDEFDSLVRIVKGRATLLETILSTVVSSYGVPQKEKFIFGMHLNEFGRPNADPHPNAIELTEQLFKELEREFILPSSAFNK